MSSFGLLSLMLLGFALGLRHGIDWDHIAAITDITGSVVTTDEAEELYQAGNQGAVSNSEGPAQMTLTKPVVRRKRRREVREGFFLATMYALGHASLVVLLGLLALWLGAILPNWIDPIMERLVGVTLIILGVGSFTLSGAMGARFNCEAVGCWCFLWWAAVGKLSGAKLQDDLLSICMMPCNTVLKPHLELV